MPVTDKPLRPHLPTVRQPISANVYLRRDPLELEADVIGKFVYNFTQTHNITYYSIIYYTNTKTQFVSLSPR